MNTEMFEEITNNKLFSYKVKMASILFTRQETYEILLEDSQKTMLNEGQPSAICETVFKELYETKAWYIPDRLKFWDRRFGKLFERPFFAFDDEEDTWSTILNFYCGVSTPKKEEYQNIRTYNKDWEFFAEMLAVAKHNSHPLFEQSYCILHQKGLPDKIFKKKQDELEKFYLPNNKEKFGIEHFGYAKIWRL